MAAALLLAATLGLPGRSASGHAAWLTVEGGPLEQIARGSGRLVTVSRSVVTAAVEGHVLETLVRVGDAVEAGELIVRLASPALEQQLQEAELRVFETEAEAGSRRARAEAALASRALERERAELERALAQAELEAARALGERGVVGALHVQQAEIRMLSRELELRAARSAEALAGEELERESRLADSALELARLRLERLREAQQRLEARAPQAGRVLSLPLTAGASVRSGETLFSVGAERPERAQVAFAQRHAGAIQPGLRVELEVLERRIGGLVSRVSAELVNGQVIAEVEPDLMPEDARIDMSVRVLARLGSEPEALHVPAPPELHGEVRRLLLEVDGERQPRWIEDVRSFDGRLLLPQTLLPGQRVRILEWDP